MQSSECNIKPAWRHPYLFRSFKEKALTEKELTSFAYDYYLRFLPFFRNQPEGNLHPGTVIKFTGRMKKKLGLADMSTHEIRLNRTYFLTDPKLLPYTLFHEMVHLWLFDCMYDPGHTKRFYEKMKHFEKTGLPIDKNVHIHRRLASEGNHIYVCPGCDSRWFFTKKLRRPFVCAHCYEKTGAEIYPAYYSHRESFQAIMTDIKRV
jgi:hypothetical protein